MKFRKKPVVIDAIRYAEDESNRAEVFAFCDRDGAYIDTESGELVIRTWEDGTVGRHVASPGDWIIRGVEGECYPCKPSIFEASYEAAPADKGGDEA